MDNGEDVTWTGVAEAATRLGTSPAAIRKRIKRGSMESRRGNDGTIRVLLTSTSRPGRFQETSRAVQETSVDMAGLVDRAARAEGELVGLREALARADAALTRVEAALVAERARADRLVAELALARKGWLERLLEALRRR
jgi:hypothetical protein